MPHDDRKRDQQRHVVSVMYQERDADIAQRIKEAEQMVEDILIYQDHNLDMFCRYIKDKDHKRGLYYL